MKWTYDDWYDAATLTKNIEKKTKGTFSINEVLRINAGLYPSNLFMNSFGEKIAWDEGLKEINRLANSFKKLGIKKGDKISILCGDSDKFVLTDLAIMKAGAVVVTLNTRLATAAAEIEFILRDSDSRLLVIEDKYAGILGQFNKANLPELKHIVSIGHIAPGTVSWAELLSSGSEDDPGVKVGGDEQAMQLYTSGTTGRPKGAMLTHISCLAQMDQMSHVGAYTPQDRVQNMLPFPHCGFICFSMSALYAGAGLNIIYPFEPAKCIGFAMEQKTTVMAIVPAMVNMVLNLPDVQSYDLSSLRLIMYGSAPMPYAMIQKMRELWPWLKLQNIFGMTECSAAITSMKDEDALTKIAGVGKVVPGGTLRVVGEKGADAKIGDVGEIIYKGPNVMQGYYKNPDATAKALEGGWYHTGDLGTLDEDGILKIVDRAKDMLIRGGENVYPAEVERVLFEIPAVLDCAVVGVPEERLGERTKAFIVLKQGQSLTPAEVVDHCKKKLAMFKVPEVIEFIKEIPRTPMAKIDKVALRALPRNKEWRAWDQKK